MIKVLAGLVFPEGHKGRSVLSVSPWIVDGYVLPVASHGLPSTPFCVLIFSSYKDISHTG